MTKTDSNAVWSEIDIATLTPGQSTAYNLYKDAQRRAAQLRTEFENTMNTDSGLPQGKRLVFGYRFGKLSAAVVDDDRKPKAKGNVARSLADYLAEQANR